MENTNTTPSLLEMQAQLHLLAHKVQDLETALASLARLQQPREAKHATKEHLGSALAEVREEEAASSSQALTEEQQQQLQQRNPKPRKRKHKGKKDAATQTDVAPMPDQTSTDMGQASGGDAGGEGAEPGNAAPPLRRAAVPPRRGIHDFGHIDTSAPSRSIFLPLSLVGMPGIMPDRSHIGWLEDNFLAEERAMGIGRGKGAATLPALPPLPPLPWLPPLPPLLSEESHPVIACGPGISGLAEKGGRIRSLPSDNDHEGNAEPAPREILRQLGPSLGYPWSAEADRILVYWRELEEARGSTEGGRS